MPDKKHIDRLFQESFKDFEATPSDAVWKNIEAQLNQKKKKRRVIPIWWRYAGVAALLLLLLTVGINYFNNENESKINKIVDTENKATDASIDQDERPNSFNELNKTNEAITNNNMKDDNLKAVDGPILRANSENNGNEKASENVLNDNIDTSKAASIAETSAPININESKINDYLTSDKKPKASNSKVKTEDKTVIVSNLKEESNAPNENNILIDKTEVLNNNSINNTTIAQNKTLKEEEKSETLAENSLEKNALTIEEALDKTKDIPEKEKLNRWSIAPNAAPVYFNTLGEGSSIDPQFNSNSKSGDVNMSYGISASYAVNKKLSIRSGINRVNLGYNTNNVVVFQSVGVSSSSILRNVDVNTNSAADALTNGNTETISIISGAGFNANNVPESLATNTSINQSLGYIEVPLEIQYNLLDKKFGVNVIGGFSSFFLSDNKIFSDAEGGGRTFLGEATNINNVSYSANFGLGLNYQMSKKIDLNFEPMFKYQMNTFNNTSGDFKPFFIGVYTGFAIKF
jgi:hypothetical protein